MSISLLNLAPFDVVILNLKAWRTLQTNPGSVDGSKKKCCILG